MRSASGDWLTAWLGEALMLWVASEIVDIRLVGSEIRRIAEPFDRLRQAALQSVASAVARRDQIDAAAGQHHRGDEQREPAPAAATGTVGLATGASTTRRPVCDWKTRCCSADDSRA